MTKIAVGVDIIEIDRVRQAAADYRNAFLKRIYTDAELDSSASRPDGLAARFAAKEAVILTGVDGAPYIRLYGRACDKAKELGLSEFSLSLSHSKTCAIAMVVGYAA